MFITREFLVIFGAPWNKQGRWGLSGTGVSGCKSKDVHLLLTSCDYQVSHDKVIEEGNSYFSRWISDVASTRFIITTPKCPWKGAEYGLQAVFLVMQQAFLVSFQVCLVGVRFFRSPFRSPLGVAWTEPDATRESKRGS